MTCNNTFLLLGVCIIGAAQIYLIWLASMLSYNKMYPAKSSDDTTLPSTSHDTSLPSTSRDTSLPSTSHDTSLPSTSHDTSLPSRTGDIVIDLLQIGDRFVGKITVGYPKEGNKEQVLNVGFSPSFGYFWLASIDACPERKCQTFTGFDGVISEHYKPFKNRKSSFVTDDFHVSGFVSKDQYKLGRDNKEILIPEQEFTEVTSLGGALIGYDGEFGLSLESEYEYYQSPVMTLMEQKNIEPVFGFFITNKQDNTAVSGKLIFGGKDEDLMEGELQSHNVKKFFTREAYLGWIVDIEKIIIVYPEGKREEIMLSLKLATPAPEQTGIVLASLDAYNINNKILVDSKINYNFRNNEFTCNSDITRLPDIVIVMDGKEYTMSPSEYITEKPGKQGNTDKTCSSGIKGSYYKYVKLGQSFMRKFYTRFNWDTKQVQFAKAKHGIIEK